MRIAWLRYLALIAATAGPVSGFDRVELDVTVNDSARTISGRVSVDFEPRPVELTELRFRLYANVYRNKRDSSDSGTEVDSVLIDGRDVTSRVTLDGTDFLVTLPGPVGPGVPVSADIRFVTHVPEDPGRLGYNRDQFTLAGWFPMPAPWADTGWVRIEYGENSEPAADLCDMDATIRLADTLQLIAPGIVSVEHGADTQVVRISLHPAQDVPVVIATGYEADETVCGGTTLKILFRPEHAYVLDTVRETACRTLAYMSENILPYPFDEFVVVVGGYGIGGGVELPRMILLGKPGAGLFTRFYPAMVIHEVVHQWFYGMLASDQANEPWLDESVAEFFTVKINRLMTHGRGDLFSQFGFSAGFESSHRTTSYPVQDLVPIDRPADAYGRGEYFAAVYSKGALVMMTLTRLMGAEQERQFWQEYAGRFQFTRPTRADFVSLATEYMPTGDTADVAALISTIAPLDFAIRSVSVTRDETAADSTADSARPEPQYRITVEYTARHPLGFPVDLRLEYQDGTVQDTTVTPTPGRHRLVFHHSNGPACVTIDPEYTYAIDRNLLNNSIQFAGPRGVGPRLFSGVLFLVESLFSLLWGF
ncbi:MAG TPA: M1 family aminopeptidase [Acidobacteriota bacterium]|nr:M1 family aminopeptidase [Acidobacteriota bacterium]